MESNSRVRPPAVGQNAWVPGLRLIVFVSGLLLLGAGIVLLVTGSAWGLGLAFVGFAVASMSFPRLPGDDEDRNPRWTGSGPIGP
jgi:hypothetical protein